MEDSDLIAKVKKDQEKISSILKDKNLLKYIVVKNKLVNFIVKMKYKNSLSLNNFTAIELRFYSNFILTKHSNFNVVKVTSNLIIIALQIILKAVCFHFQILTLAEVLILK